MHRIPRPSVHLEFSAPFVPSPVPQHFSYSLCLTLSSISQSTVIYFPDHVSNPFKSAVDPVSSFICFRLLTGPDSDEPQERCPDGVEVARVRYS